MNLQEKREKGYSGSVLVVSPMLKLTKMMETIEKPIGINKTANLFVVGGFFVYT